VPVTRQISFHFGRVIRGAILVLLCAPGLARAASDDLNPFGVSSSAQASGSYATWMPKMAAAGVKWVRLFPEWNQIQPTANTWNWSLMDAMLNTASNQNLNLTGLFLYNASWVNANTHTFPTNNYPAWSAYVSNVVRHASGRVKYWEVWNEPESFAAGGSPAEYARVVTNAYNAAKAADPNAQIGLSVASVDILYLEQTIQAGAADHFDFICVHPYEVLDTLHSGQEALFMNIVPTIRKMLAARNPAKWKVPVWFTEIGQGLGGQVTTTSQAQDVIKTYTMAIAQGVKCVQWFEAREGGYSMGLLNSSGNPNPAYFALSNLVAQLGPNPTCKGWLLLNDRNYGFVFQGAATNVLATWAPPNTTNDVDFGQSVRILNPLTSVAVSASVYSLSNAPILVVGVPASLVAQAETNKTRPFPWNGNFSGVSSVSAAMGNPNVDSGLHQLNPESSSTAVTVFGGPARDCSKGSSVAFTIDPNFLSYTRAPIRISAVVRKISAGDNPGFNLKYESATGRKGIGWNSVPGADKWYTLNWTISDDEFVGNWGYHFSFDCDSTNYSRYYLQQVTVTNLAPGPSAPPTGFIATPGPGLVALRWNSIPGATGYDLKRSTASGGPHELLTPALAATNYIDAGLTPGVSCYYVVSAVNLGGVGPDSLEVTSVPLAPALSIWPGEGSLRLSWPTSVTAFALQETEALPGGWTNAAAAIQIQDGANVALVPAADRSKFYRLAR